LEIQETQVFLVLLVLQGHLDHLVKEEKEVQKDLQDQSDLQDLVE